jgi:hypothetical protein
MIRSGRCDLTYPGVSTAFESVDRRDDLSRRRAGLATRLKSGNDRLKTQLERFPLNVVRASRILGRVETFQPHQKVDRPACWVLHHRKDGQIRNQSRGLRAQPERDGGKGTNSRVQELSPKQSSLLPSIPTPSDRVQFLFSGRASSPA